ncbi:Protein FAM228B [Manis javanica]|nr:Protein FAM228B [Manis javanica]
MEQKVLKLRLVDDFRLKLDDYFSQEVEIISEDLYDPEAYNPFYMTKKDPIYGRDQCRKRLAQRVELLSARGERRDGSEGAQPVQGWACNLSPCCKPADMLWPHHFVTLCLEDERQMKRRKLIFHVRQLSGDLNMNSPPVNSPLGAGRIFLK